MNRQALNALDRIDQIMSCFEAVGDLLNPERDLHAVNREAHSALINMLTNELIMARKDLHENLKSQA